MQQAAQEGEGPRGGEAWGREDMEPGAGSAPEGGEGVAWKRGHGGGGRRVHGGADCISEQIENNRKQVSHCSKQKRREKTRMIRAALQ